MNSVLKNLIVLLSFSFLSAPLQAETISESAFLLREAMMQSNADYNKYKKKVNHEEFDRADEWGERETKAISITGVQMRPITDEEEFQELKSEFKSSDREVSSNQID